jgi:hypothetical protein
VIKIHDPDQVYIRNGCILNAHWRIKGVFDNLVKFVYKLGKNWQTRAWDPFSKLLDSHLMRQWFWGYFHKKNLKISIDRKLYWIVNFYLDFFVPHQNDIATTKIMKWTGQGRKFFLQTPKSKINKKTFICNFSL